MGRCGAYDKNATPTGGNHVAQCLATQKHAPRQIRAECGLPVTPSYARNRLVVGVRSVADDQIDTPEAGDDRSNGGDDVGLAAYISPEPGSTDPLLA